MLKVSTLLGTAFFLGLAASGVEAAPMNKCIVNGTVTYQQVPCPSGQVRKPPTIKELNAGEKKKRAAAAAAAAAPPSTETTAPSTSTVSGGFSCDGRQYCSQMKSCAEAKYFLANCPGAKMDGDRNGIPCEQQWCNR